MEITSSRPRVVAIRLETNGCGLPAQQSDFFDPDGKRYRSLPHMKGLDLGRVLCNGPDSRLFAFESCPVCLAMIVSLPMGHLFKIAKTTASHTYIRIIPVFVELQHIDGYFEGK